MDDRLLPGSNGCPLFGDRPSASLHLPPPGSSRGANRLRRTPINDICTPHGGGNELMLSTIRSACLAAGLSILALAAVSPAAQAGTYRQYTCKLPDGTPAGTDGWTADAATPF